MGYIIYFFFGLIGYWLQYGNVVTGNEITFAVYILGGYFTFWIVVLIKSFWIALAILVLVGAVLYFGHRYQKYRMDRRREQFLRNRKRGL